MAITPDSAEKPVIFFDIGHTLVTGSPASPRRLIGHRLNLTEKEIKTIGKLIMTHHSEEPETLAHAISHEIEIEYYAVSKAIQEIWEEQLHCVELLPGVEKTVESLKASGYRLGLISNIWHPFFQGFKQRYPRVVNCFTYKILSYREGVKKPSPEIYLKAAQRAGCPPEDCWMIGDTYELDIAPALNLGFKTIWFILRPDRETELVAGVIRGELPPPDYAVSSIKEVLNIFPVKN